MTKTLKENVSENILTFIYKSAKEYVLEDVVDTVVNEERVDVVVNQTVVVDGTGSTGSTGTGEAGGAGASEDDQTGTGELVDPALGTAILVAIIVLCVPFTLPKILGYQAYTVISGSMEPAISVGSLVYVRSQELDKIQVGEVIAYLGGHDTNSVITHRVVENKIADRKFITKGDANQTTDMNAVAYQHLLGKVEYIVPKLGIIAQFLTRITGKFAVGCMVVTEIILQVGTTLLDKKKEEG